MPSPSAVSTQVQDVFVVDDHAVFAESLAFVLDADPAFGQVRVTRSLAEARAQLGTSGPAFDLALVDVHLEDGDGIDLVPELRAACPDALVFVLTAHPRPGVVQRARIQGAHGVLTKGSGLQELLVALRSSLAGAPGTWPETSETPVLSVRELDVVRLLAAGHEVRGIANALGISVHTVRDHVKNILTKLGAHNQLGAVIAAHRAGLITLDGS